MPNPEPLSFLIENAPDYKLAVTEAYAAAVAAGSDRLSIRATVDEIGSRYELTVPQTNLLLVDTVDMLVSLVREVLPLEERVALEEQTAWEGMNARLTAALDGDDL